MGGDQITHTISGEIKSDQGSGSSVFKVETGSTLKAGSVNNAWGMAMVVDGKLNITGDSGLILKSNSTETISGAGSIETTKIDFGNFSKYTFTLDSLKVGDGGIVFEDQSALTLTINGTAVEVQGAVKAQNGTMVLKNGSMSFGASEGNYIKNFTYVNGTLTHSALTVENAEFSGQTLVNTGALTLTGVVNVTDAKKLLKGDGVYSDAVNGNGFFNGQHYIIKGEEGSSLTYGDSFAVQYQGTAVEANTVDKGDSDLLISINDTSTYYVNNGTVIFAGENATAGTEQAGAFVIKSGATLQLNGEVASAVTVCGDGTLALLSGTSAMPADVQGVSDAENWTGIVKISGHQSVEDLNFSNYGNENSWVQLVGLTGYWALGTNNALDISTNIILGNETGASVDAFTHDNGYSSTVYTISGDVKGTGNLKSSRKQGGATVKIVFAGDVSGWTGSYINESKASELTFEGKAKDINAILTQSGGTLNVTVNTDAAAVFSNAFKGNKLTLHQSATFNANVDASQIVSDTGTSVTLGANVTLKLGATVSTIDTLNAANGSVHIADGGTLKLGNADTETVSSIGTISTTTAGTIHLNKAATLNAFTKGEGSGTITFTGSGVVNLNIGKAGETTNMRGAVINEGAGTLNVTVQGDTIFNADVDVSNLTITGGGGLTLGAGSELTVNKVIQNNGALDIQGTVNWDLSSAEGLTVTYDLNRTTNGLGAVDISGLITGSGKLVNHGDIAVTVNDKTGTLATGTGLVTVDDVVYYVMSLAENEDDGYEYSMFGEYANSSDVVYVGVHTYPSPIANAEANDALGFYVGENGILGIIGDSNTMSSGEILAQTQGEGTIILRAPGTDNEKDEDEMRENLYVTVDSETQFAGNLSIATQLLKSSAEAETKSVYLHLEDKADISSFSSIEMGNGTHILLDGIIKKSESKKGHINNLTNSGSGFTYLYINQGANKELVLGGDTTLRTYAHIPATGENEGYEQGSYMRLVFNQNAQVTIENLTTGGDTLENMYWNTLEITSAYETLYANDKVVNGIVNIESFDYLGFIYLSAGTEGSILANLNLKAWQTLYDYQYSRDITAVGDKGLIIKGEGTYELSEGNSILSNFGVLSTEFTEDGARIWQGTVEVNNLDASGAGIKIADYGNEKSKIHFKGFKGYLTDDATEVEIKPALILENTYNEDGSLNMSGYEITGGGEEQAQTYTGVISGTGDFVVSAAENMTFNLQGNISEWVADGTETPEFIVQNGTQELNFSGKATEVNAIIKVAPSEGSSNAALNVSVGDANTAHTTTFTNEVNVTKISVSAGSTAKLEAASSAGNINIGSYGDGMVATLSKGLTIEENTVGHGHIADAMISQIQKAGRVELVEVTATNLYLCGDQVQFHSTDSKHQFEFDKQILYGSERVNEVVFTSEIFRGMILSDDGAQLTLTVDNAVVWGDAVQPDWTNVTIKLVGFTIEQLADTAGDWDWKKFGLSFDSNSASVATLDNAALSTTVSDLLNADYDFVVYEQNASGLTIHMYNTPEPTTATLSMLALAALAARRRRRK